MTKLIETTNLISARQTLPSAIDPSSESVASGYDAIADAYVKHVFLELGAKPFDRAFLNQFTSFCEEGDLILDLGCGPGHVGRYLSERGVRVCGIDLSQRMVDLARQLNPGMPILCEDMRALPFATGAVAGLVAFYSIIHLPLADVPAAFCEMIRVLRPGGALAIAFHIGDKVQHLDELWGVTTKLDFMFFEPERIRSLLTEAGFAVIHSAEREPYAASIEAQTRRCYMLARRLPAVDARDAKPRAARGILTPPGDALKCSQRLAWEDQPLLRRGN